MTDHNPSFDGRDTVVIPSVTGLMYKLDGRPVDAGEHKIAGSVQVSVRPVPGYILGDSVIKEHYFVAKTEDDVEKPDVSAAKTVVDSESKVDDVVAGKDADPVVTNNPSGNTTPGTVRSTNLSSSNSRS